MMDVGQMWDIRDREPVELPPAGADVFEVIKMPQLSRNVELDRYERSVAAMPPVLRGRYLRAMSTAEQIMAIARHGVRLGLTGA